MMDTDWLELWRQLASAFHRPERSETGRPVDTWQRRVRRFDASVKRRSARPDPLRDFVLSQVGPHTTAIDIGAGTGSWAIALAKVVEGVTAVEPSEAMASVLKENLAAEGLANVAIVQSRWEETEVGPHDIAICSHAMYTSPDLVGFVRKMERTAKTCFLVMRVPSADGVLGDVSRLIRGHMHDSPNFIVGYNALLSAGIYASAMVEPNFRPWTNDSLDSALQRVRDHMRLGDDHTYDAQIRVLLEEKLVFKDGLYFWPDGMRSALVYWKSPATGP